MPELPEVETVRVALRPHLLGATVTALTVREPRLRVPVDAAQLQRRLCGRRFEELSRRGKNIILETDGEYWGVVHLGMTGRLRVEPVGSAPGTHDHIVLELNSAHRFVFHDPRRFGSFQTCCRPDGREDPELLQGLGPEPLGPDFTGEYVHKNTRGRHGLIKNLLLDQRFVAGLGNIYVNEALFRAGISPRRHPANLGAKAAVRLATAVKSVLTDALAAGGTTIRDFRSVDGSEGSFVRCLSVYGREGVPCPRCGDIAHIRRTVIGGRAAYYCPHCQR